MLKYTFLNTNYITKVYDSYNFDFDDNYDDAIQNLSKSGNLRDMSLEQIDILRDELDDYFDGIFLLNTEALDDCHIMFNEIIDDIEYDILN